jgi:hypothetical protein
VPIFADCSEARSACTPQVAGNFGAVRRSCLHDDAAYARAPTRRHVAKWFGAPVKSVLVAYGLPPNRVHLFSATGRDLHTEWKFDPTTFNGRTRQMFEQLLRTALNSFLMSEVPEIAHAHYRFITSAGELRAALHGGRYTHIVYYGHAVDDGATLKPLHKITVTELRHLLQGSGVDHIDLLGCKSTTFASQLASVMPNLSVGNLRGKRFDDIEVDLRSMQLTNFTIVPQVVFHFSPAPAAK